MFSWFCKGEVSHAHMAIQDQDAISLLQNLL